jgi:hypothetical protein
MSAGASFLVMITIFAGTVAILAVLRMIGVYGAATHDWSMAQFKSPPAGHSSAASGMDPTLLIAILTAAAVAELGTDDIRLTSVQQISAQQNSVLWPAQGRQMIMQSHRLRS